MRSVLSWQCPGPFSEEISVNGKLRRPGRVGPVWLIDVETLHLDHG
jgi:hypothetical protein